MICSAWCLRTAGGVKRALWLIQEGSRDLQEGHPSVTKGASPSAKHPLKVPFTKAWKASRGLHLRKGGLEGGLKGASRGLEGLQGGFKGA